MKKEQLISMIENGDSISVISSKTGKGKTTIRYWLKKLGLKTQNNLHNKRDNRECGSCGETRPEEMRKAGLCKSCHNKDTIRRGRQKKVDLVGVMGGECRDCGYSKNYAAFEFHHLDTTQKDPKFKNLRYWSLERAKAELEGCVLLCANCHRERHNPDFEIL